jgi:hypothetical protein
MQVILIMLLSPSLCYLIRLSCDKYSTWQTVLKLPQLVFFKFKAVTEQKTQFQLCNVGITDGKEIKVHVSDRL